MSEISESDPVQKIAAYKEQLAQIEAYLTSDQTNPEWLKCKRDIENVIKMTETLMHVQDKETQGGIEPSSSGTNASVPTSEADVFQAITTVQIGDRVEVIGDRAYAGVVTGVSDDLSECTLKYYEVGKEVTLPLTRMRKLTTKHGLTTDQVGPGLKCQCRFAADRKWYDVVIDELTPHGYIVSYTKFGNKEEVPLEYLRHTPIAVLKGDKGESGGIVIPDNLKILPTDTEEEKLKKKKRIKGIKSKNRLENIDNERSAVQNTWKAFSTKTSKMKKTGGIPHVKKRSMFASPEEVDGKVGVTRSGLGMTHTEDRKRYKLNGPN
jgi:survival of motor neuron-related-splicing factor 30